MVLRLGDDHAVDQHTGDHDLLGVQRALRGQALDLHDHQPAAVVHGRGDGAGLQDERLALHRDVALGIRGRPPQQGHVQPVERRVGQVLGAVDLDQRDFESAPVRQLRRSSWLCVPLSARMQTTASADRPISSRDNEAVVPVVASSATATSGVAAPPITAPSWYPNDAPL